MTFPAQGNTPFFHVRQREVFAKPFVAMAAAGNQMMKGQQMAGATQTTLIFNPVLTILHGYKPVAGPASGSNMSVQGPRY